MSGFPLSSLLYQEGKRWYVLLSPPPIIFLLHALLADLGEHCNEN